MPKNVRIIILAITFVVVIATLWPRLADSRPPGSSQGYSPVQPIDYSHRLHAGELGIACLYCHFGAERSRVAGIPPANVCMNCHRSVRATFGARLAAEEAAKAEERTFDAAGLVSDKLQVLYDHVGFDLKTGEWDLKRGSGPIRWKQVHRLPDFVYFDHRAHVRKGVDCQRCHGAVESMERVRQWSNLTMGWCVNCHRDAQANGIKGQPANPSNDCSTCHY